LHFGGGDIPGGLPYIVASDGSGGTQITTPTYTDYFSSAATNDPGIIQAIDYLDYLAGKYSPGSSDPLNGAVTPTTGDVRVSIGALASFTQALPVIYASPNHDFVLDGNDSRQLTSNGTLTSQNSVLSTQSQYGLVFASGRSFIDNLTINANGSPNPGSNHYQVMHVLSGATVYWDNSYDIASVGTATIEAGGTFVVHSGQVGTITGVGNTPVGASIPSSMELVIAPPKGQTATVGGIAGGGYVAIGDPAVETDGATTLVGGTAAFSPDAVSNNPATDAVIFDDTTLQFSGANPVNTVEFDSPVGAVLQFFTGGPAIKNVKFDYGIGEIDLPDLSTTTPTLLTADANGVIPTLLANGVNSGPTPFNNGTNDPGLPVSGAFGPGSQFVAVEKDYYLNPNNPTVATQGARLIPVSQSTTLKSELEFDTLVSVIDGLPSSSQLPANTTLSFTVTMSGMLTLTEPHPALVAPSGLALDFKDGASGPSGFTLASGVTATLDGNNTFTGGVTLMADSMLTLGSANAAGTAGVTFAGADAALSLSAAGLSAPIRGFGTSDVIRVVGMKMPVGGVLTLDATGHGTITTTAGQETLYLPDMPNAQLAARTDSTGAILLSPNVNVALTDNTGAQAAASAMASGTLGSGGSQALVAGGQAPVSGGNQSAGSPPVYTSNPMLTGHTSLPNALVLVSVDGSGPLPVRADGSGNWTFLPEGLADGTHTVIAGQADNIVGEIGETSLTFTLITTPPAAPAITGVSPEMGATPMGAQTDTNNVTISGTAVAGATAISVFDGTTLLGKATPANGTWSFTPSQPLPAGNNTLTAVAIDAAGNNSVASDPFVVDVELPATSSGQPVTTEAQLNLAIIAADAATSGTVTIGLGADISLGTALEAINLKSGVTLDIEGNGYALDGGSQHGGSQRGLFIYSGAVTVHNLTLQNMTAQGGAGGNPGGGGGAGLGGGLFVAGTGDPDQAVTPAVTLDNVTFSNDAAIGGNGGASNTTPGVESPTYGLGGGGGLGGNGGSLVPLYSGQGAGGGGIGIGAAGGGDPEPLGQYDGGAGIVPGAAGGGSVILGSKTWGAGGASGGGGGGGAAQNTPGNGASEAGEGRTFRVIRLAKSLPGTVGSAAAAPAGTTILPFPSHLSPDKAGSAVEEGTAPVHWGSGAAAGDLVRAAISSFSKADRSRSSAAPRPRPERSPGEPRAAALRLLAKPTATAFSCRAISP
jgi:Bacterial Ig-like domain